MSCNSFLEDEQMSKCGVVMFGVYFIFFIVFTPHILVFLYNFRHVFNVFYTHYVYLVFAGKSEQNEIKLEPIEQNAKEEI